MTTAIIVCLAQVAGKTVKECAERREEIAAEHDCCLYSTGMTGRISVCVNETTETPASWQSTLSAVQAALRAEGLIRRDPILVAPTAPKLVHECLQAFLSVPYKDGDRAAKKAVKLCLKRAMARGPQMELEADNALQWASVNKHNNELARVLLDLEAVV